MVYEYTKPRGPVAAMYSSPGPCYKLPSLIGQVEHDIRSSHKKEPAFPFGIRHREFSSSDQSPGPCYSLPPLQVSHKNAPPKWTLSPRCYPPESRLSVPGPGAYDLTTSGRVVSESAPAFSFGTRHRSRKTDNQPAPNNYLLPQLVSNRTHMKTSAPQYSLTGRSKVGGFHEDLQKTPGPGAYATSDCTNVVKEKAPAYSMTGRNSMPGDSTVKPGPGAHNVVDGMNVVNQKPPSFSFGIRHSQYSAPIADIPEDE